MTYGDESLPVRADSNIPKGAINLRNEFIRVGFAELSQFVSCNKGTHLRDANFDGLRSYISTIQLLVLISSTFPPN